MTGGGARSVEISLGDMTVASIESQAGAGVQPVQLGGAEILASRLGASQTLLDSGQRLVRSAKLQPSVGQQHEEIGVHKDRTHGRASVEEISHLLGGAWIPLLVNRAPCGQDARFGVVHSEAVLVGEPREQGGPAVELFEVASELQQHRPPVVGVRDHLGLPERQRMRNTLRVTGERPLGIAQKK